VRRRWNRWRFQQHSRIVFALVPHGWRYVAAGPVECWQLVEFWS
jgi:hypothetical protein